MTIRRTTRVAVRDTPSWSKNLQIHNKSKKSLSANQLSNCLNYALLNKNMTAFSNTFGQNRSKQIVVGGWQPLWSEHVSAAWVADFLLTTQAYFCDIRSPLCSRSTASRSPLHSHSPDFLLPRSRSALLTCSFSESQPCRWFNFHNN